jgi:FMN reductase
MAPTSSTVAALKLALAGAEEAGAETRLFEISALDLPMFVPGAEAPESARQLTDAIHEADGLLWSSPVYHGTISGSFKNALDWLQLLSDRQPPYLAHKLVGLIGTAPGLQGLLAINTLEAVVSTLGGWPVPLLALNPRVGQGFDEQLRALGQEIVRAARQFQEEGRSDYDQRKA